MRKIVLAAAAALTLGMGVASAQSLTPSNHPVPAINTYTPANG